MQEKWSEPRAVFLRALSVVLACCMLLTTGLFAAAAEDDDAPEFKAKRYEIAVVFDNSGSMYINGNTGDGKTWCQAKYAMEIFASMLDYDAGDALHIFPMWKVETDRSGMLLGGGAADANDRIDIKNKKDIDKIHNMFTITASGTPFEPVNFAKDYLDTIRGDDVEKWLIILTDGDFEGISSVQLNEKVNNEIVSSDMKVQYLGVGKGLKKPGGNESAGFYVATAASGADLQKALVDICNKIFQRNVLPANRLQGSTLKLDLSMRKVIVFAQGDAAEIGSLSDAKGKQLPKLQDSGKRTYSQLSAGNYPDAPADTSLAGEVVTFNAAPAGDYTLDFKGADKIQVFYEPDVRIKTVLKNSDGVEVNENDPIYEGKYKLENQIIDRVTGEDVSGSELLGQNVVYDIKVGGQSVDNNSTIELKAGTDVNIDVSATYLGKYTIHNSDSPFFKGIHIELPDTDALQVKFVSDEKVPWYRTTAPDSWKPLKVVVSLNGNPLTRQQLEELDIRFGFEKGDVVFTSKLMDNEDAFEIRFGTGEDGKFVKPKDGTYRFTAKATTIDKFDRTLMATDSISVTFQWYSKWILAGISLLIFLILAAIIYFIMSRKVLPKRVSVDTTEYRLKGKPITTGSRMQYDRKSARIVLQSAPAPVPESVCRATFKLYPVDKRWTPSKKRRFGISAISGTGIGVTSVSINGSVYKKNKSGKFVSSIDPEAPIKEEGRCPMLIVNAQKAILTCTTKQK